MNRIPGLLIVCMLLVLAATGTDVWAGNYQVPAYTPDQLKDKAFVAAELETIMALRVETEKQLAAASPIQKVTIRANLTSLDMVLEALRYVQKNGYQPRDLERWKLDYFQRKDGGTLPVKVPPPPPEDPSVHRLEEAGLVPPVPIETPPVEVPDHLIGQGLKGYVKVHFVINEKGNPERVEVLEGISKEIDELVAATILMKYRYQPALLEGKPVKAGFNMIITFDLKPGAGETAPPATTEEGR